MLGDYFFNEDSKFIEEESKIVENVLEPLIIQEADSIIDSSILNP